MRWRLGTYLGMAPSSNECYIANVDGDVMKSRSVARVVAGSRWDPEAMQKIREVPGQLTAMNPASLDFSHIEELPDPHR